MPVKKAKKKLARKARGAQIPYPRYCAHALGAVVRASRE